MNLEALSFWLEISLEQTAVISMVWGGFWPRSVNNSSHVSEDLAPPERQEPEDDQKLAGSKSKPLLGQTHIYFKFLVLDEYLYQNRASGNIPSACILRVLPFLSHVDQTQESGRITAKCTLFEVQEILRRPWTFYSSLF
jgi:hypothetical protein